MEILAHNNVQLSLPISILAHQRLMDRIPHIGYCKLTLSFDLDSSAEWKLLRSRVHQISSSSIVLLHIRPGWWWAFSIIYGHPSKEIAAELMETYNATTSCIRLRLIESETSSVESLAVSRTVSYTTIVCWNLSDLLLYVTTRLQMSGVVLVALRFMPQNLK